MEAAKAAINSPLLELSIEGAKGILFNVIAGPDLKMHELADAAKVITAQADPNAKIIYGTVIDENMKDTVRITVIATGFGEDGKAPVRSEASFRPSLFMRKAEKPQAGAQKTADVKSTKEEAEEEDAAELDIPAFIRKKMG